MSYENEILAELKHGNLMYNSGLTNGKRLALSIIELKLLESNITQHITYYALFDLLAELRSEFNDDSMTSEQYEQEARLTHYTSEAF
tara:strand:- start:2423 stop:2683 length:261 start_codon:yes stop_codon:yes gene_type:complete